MAFPLPGRNIFGAVAALLFALLSVFLIKLYKQRKLMKGLVGSRNPDAITRKLIA
jgi:hypothetical protein